ncbi:MAG TPA: hypothetical protein VEJ23_09040 [Solirubrobacteraceae bacterium]|nr:hypothetical protein [Solirubrobacteraceae bacterium]
MSKVWVLDTETKGTGAQMVPYEKTLRPARREDELALVRLGSAAHPAVEPEPEPPAPLRFKVVDVMSAQVLGADVSAREAVQLLEGMRSVLDARIFVWGADTGRWRLLSLEESKTLWGFRGRVSALDPDRS